MTTDDEVLSLFVEGDPARAAGGIAPRADAARYLDTLMDRETALTLTETRVKGDVRRSNPRWLLTAAAIALVVIAASGWGFVNGGSRPTNRPPIEPPTPVEVAKRFLDAYTTYDTSTAATYLADPTWAGLAPDWRLGIRFMKATGTRFIVTSCHDQATTSLGSVVRCPFDYQALRSAELGHGPYTGSTIDVTISDEKVVVAAAIQFRTVGNRFDAEMGRPFAAWLLANHPDEADLLFTDKHMVMFRITEESVPLWETRTREYVQDVLAGTTPKP